MQTLTYHPHNFTYINCTQNNKTKDNKHNNTLRIKNQLHILHHAISLIHVTTNSLFLLPCHVFTRQHNH